MVDLTRDAGHDLGTGPARTQRNGKFARRVSVCMDMEQGPDSSVAYLSRVAGGLVACAVLAATLHADVAAAAMLGAVLLVVIRAARA